MAKRSQTTLINIYLLFLTIVYIVSTPILLLLALPIYITRLIVKYFGLLFKSNELGSMLSTRNAIFAIDNITQPPTANVVVCITLDGILNLVELQQSVLEKIVLRRNKKGAFCYPQLQQCLTNWLGFFFWKDDLQFDIRNHVKMIELIDGSNPLEEFNMEKICDTQEILIRRPFEKNRSPWEFLVVHFNQISNIKNNQNQETNRNEVKNQSVFFFRVHHTLADGFSILKILMSDLADQKLIFPPAKPKLIRHKSTFQLLSTISTKILRIPYDQVKQRYYSKDMNVWHNESLHLSRKYHAVVSDQMEVDLIKKIKKQYPNSTFTSLILEGITCGIRSYFLDFDSNSYSDFGFRRSDLPEYIHTICPMPMTGYPDELGNHWSFCFIKLPTGVADSIERLNKINENIQELSKSNVVQTNFGLISMVGGLNNWMIQKLTKNIYSTAITSIFPGPPEPCIINGHLVTNMVFAGGLMNGDQGICFTLISYNGKFQIFLMVDRALIPSKKMAQQLLKHVYNSIINLDTDSD